MMEVYLKPGGDPVDIMDEQHRPLARILLSPSGLWLRVTMTERKKRVVRTYSTTLKAHKAANLPADEYAIDIEV